MTFEQVNYCDIFAECNEVPSSNREPLFNQRVLFVVVVDIPFDLSQIIGDGIDSFRAHIQMMGLPKGLPHNGQG